MLPILSTLCGKWCTERLKHLLQAQTEKKKKNSEAKIWTCVCVSLKLMLLLPSHAATFLLTKICGLKISEFTWKDSYVTGKKKNSLISEEQMDVPFGESQAERE